MTQDKPESGFAAIRAIDYAVIYVRDMDAMRAFYESVLGFRMLRALSENWLEYGIGGQTLALARPGLTRDEAAVPRGTAAMQLAFRVPPGDVARCAAELEAKGVMLLAPPTDQPFGHRTLFFRDPDGNVLEI